MELSTFGGVIAFAIEQEEKLKRSVEALDIRHAPDELRRIRDSVASEANRAIKRLQAARREDINEMILEPISGLDGTKYGLREKLEDTTKSQDVPRLILDLLDRMIEFYNDAGRLIPNIEVARVFTLLGRKKTKCKEDIERYLSGSG